MTAAITVSKLNNYIKQIFDSEELIHNIPVSGEIYGVSTARNAIYFSLKDEFASLPCVCFYPNLIGKIVEGSQVIATGSPNFYVKGGKLSFNVINVENDGQGKLYEEFIKLKNKLESEGLFDQSHKKDMPKVIKRIGVITSREGAVIQDIKNVAWRRDPRIDIVLFNTKVQGLGAENEIAKAIEKMGTYENVDVIIVARGGGSLEELSAYNSEIVARATYNCPKPIVSAVGHETDYTIIDFVSDLRAPTPSAAAELLTKDLSMQRQNLEGLLARFNKTAKSFIKNKIDFTAGQSYMLLVTFEKIMLNKKVELNKVRQNLIHSYQNKINSQTYELGLIENTLKKINPKTMLNMGWAKIEQNDKVVKSIDEINFKNQINIYLKDGRVTASPLQKEKNYEN